MKVREEKGLEKCDRPEFEMSLLKKGVIKVPKHGVVGQPGLKSVKF